MRLSEKYQTIIKTTFIEIFPEGDQLWLFGSRVDDAQRGGDIDLYVETNFATRQEADKARSLFWSHLQARLGEQKIDIVVNGLKFSNPLRIHEVARNAGILLV